MRLLLECWIRSVLIAAAIGVVVRGLRIRNAVARHQALSGVLFAMLWLPVFSIWGPKVTVPLLPAIVGTEFVEPAPVEQVPFHNEVAQSSQPLRFDSVSLPMSNSHDPLIVGYLVIAGLLLARHLVATTRA